jgi:hypothetical protein
MNEIDTVTVKNIENALSDRALHAKCVLIHCVGFVLDRAATKLEGCYCHEYILDNHEKPWASRVAEYRACSKDCCNKGRRAVWLSLDGCDTIVDEVKIASNSDLQKVLTTSAGPVRDEIGRWELMLKSRLVCYLLAKLFYWKRLPHSMIGVLGHHFGLCSLSRARERAGECYNEFCAAVASGSGDKVHRIAHYFLADDSPYLSP